MTPRMLLPLFLAVLSLHAAPVMRITKAAPADIAVPEQATEVENEAARELQDYLKRICGAECRIVAEKQAAGPAIHIGGTELARRSIPNYAALEAEQWAMKTVDGNLLLCGGRPRGTVYAVYEFLEKLGVVWPNAVTTYVPQMDTVTIDTMDVLDKPAIAYRQIYSGVRGGHTPEVASFMAHNKMNKGAAIPPKQGGFVHIGSPADCHTFHAYSKPEWPDEWFSLNAKGQRVRSVSSNGPGHFCLTNPDLQKAMAARLREFIEKDRRGKPRELWPTIYDVSHNDNGHPCECENCKRRAAEEGSYAGPMLDLINYMANDIAKDYPEIFVQTFAYTWTLDAPLHIKPAPNVIIRICKLGCEFLPSGKADTLSDNLHPRNRDFYDNFMKWSKIATSMIVWDYWKIYKLNYSVPYLNARNLCKDIAFYSRNHVKGMFVECESAMDTSAFHFKLWLGLKAMQNPNLNYDEMADRFCRAAYGPAASPMRQYLDYLQDRREAADQPVGLERNVMLRSFVSTKVNLPDPLVYLDRAFFEKANALLDEAEELAAGNPTHLANVRRERLPVDNALKNTYAKYVDNPPSGRLVGKDYPALYGRYEAVMKAQIRYFNEFPYQNKTTFDEQMGKLKMEHQLAFDVDGILPPELKSRQVFVVAWPGIQNNNLMKPQKDPDAFAGQTRYLAPRDTKDYHRIPYTMEVYTYQDKKGLLAYRIQEQDIPQDGKYHLYHLGRCTITPRTLVALHWTWLLSAYIDSVYLPDANNDWDVYVSLKLTGAPYVKGSQDAPAVCCDKIILAK